MSEIRAVNLHKSFGAVHAVAGVSFTARPGRVTGFLGPNGSGKTTTLRLILGLLRADQGSATIAGSEYRLIQNPASKVGVSLEAVSHPAHTGRRHLEIQCLATGTPQTRVAELLKLVGLEAAADRKTAGYSLGMRQRLALATALVADPEVLILDEPINGLDPEGIRWMREFLRFFASQGKTVLLSSHMLSEVQQGVDDVIVINAGKIVYEGTLEDVLKVDSGSVVLVDAVERDKLMKALQEADLLVTQDAASGCFAVPGATAALIGEIALAAGIVLLHLSVRERELESSFLELIRQQEGSQSK